MGVVKRKSVQERVHIAGLGLLSLEGPAHKVGPWLALGTWLVSSSALL